MLGCPLSCNSAIPVPAHQGLLSHLHPNLAEPTFLTTDTECRFTLGSRMCVCAHVSVFNSLQWPYSHSPWAQVNPCLHRGAGQENKDTDKDPVTISTKVVSFPQHSSVSCFNSNSTELKSRRDVVGGTLRKWSKGGRKRFLSQSQRGQKLSIMTSEFKRLFSCPIAPFSSLQTCIFCVLLFSCTYALCFPPEEIPVLTAMELELKFILASSHQFILSFFLSVSWTCLRFQHSVIIQYNFLVAQLEI